MGGFSRAISDFYLTSFPKASDATPNLYPQNGCVSLYVRCIRGLVIV